jgi:hypothetical protein
MATQVSDQGDMSFLSPSSGRKLTPSAFSDACRSLVRTQTPGLISALFRKLEEIRKDLVDEAASEGRHAAQADAVSAVLDRRGEIEARFLAALEGGFDAALEQGSRPLVSGAADSLSRDAERVSRERHGEDLVLTNLVSKAENRYSTQLAALRSCLAGGQDPVPGLEPLGPTAICSAFRSALDPVDGLDLSVKLAVYKVFDKQVMNGLEDLYDRCLAYAEDRAAGAADTPGRGGGADAAERVETTRVSGYLAEKGEALRSTIGTVPEGGRGGASAFEALRRGLTARWPRHRTGPVSPPVTTGELIALLSRLEREIGHGASHRSQARLLWMRLRNALRIRGDGQARGLSPEDEDTLDLVFLVFDRLLQENRLEEPIRSLIGRLQIPVARLALRDKTLFADPDHPARRLINRLVETALGWVDDGLRGPGSLSSRIELVVSQVLEDEGPHPQRIHELDAAFARLMAEEKAQARDAQERGCRELREREERSSAETVVRRHIEECLAASEEVPDALLSFVAEGWARVMVAAYREGGIEGASWQRAAVILDQLIWSVQPKLDDDDRRELLRHIPELLRNLREDLDRISYDQRRLAATFRELRALHMTALRRTGPAHGGATSRRVRQPRPTLTPPPLPPTPPAIRGEGGDGPGAGAATEPGSLKGVRLGTWLELRGDRAPRRVKLACRGPISGAYLFVDRRGQGALELDGRELAALLRKGSATIVGHTDPPPLDRAFDQLFDAGGAT